MKNILKHICSGIVILCLAVSANADIGETHTLKNKRTRILSQLHELKQDSSANEKEIDSLQLQVITLDEQIFISYDETVDRIAAQKLRAKSDDQAVVFLALTVSLIALFFAAMLFALRSRVRNNEKIGLRQFYKELSVEFAGKVSADKTEANQMLRVNVVVIVGLILMSISIFAYLIKSL